MIRTGQMILGKVFLNLFCGRNFEILDRDIGEKDSSYRQIIQWLTDSPLQKYSIHSIVERNFQIHGIDENELMKGGEWFSPNKIARVLKYLIRDHSPKGLVMYVTQDQVIYIDQVVKMCDKSKETNPKEDENNYDWRPIFILIPTRIGVNKTNKIYIPHLKNVLRDPYCVGIIGGKPKASHYFIGYQGDDIIFLDPHYVQPFQLDKEFTPKTCKTYQCKIPLKMNFEHIDPSLAVGFFFISREEFNQFCDNQTSFKATGQDITFGIEEKTPSYVNVEEN